ncbi:MAG: PKD domain-containing protein, partial [Flavobacteriales bacterium]
LTGIQPNYTYPAPVEGIYDITLIAANAAGCRDTVIHQHEVINPPQAALSLSTDMGCAPLSVSFTNGSIGQYLSYNWDLSINSSTADTPPDQTYLQGNDVTIYPIALTATNTCGNNIARDTITVMPQPIAGFGTNLDQDCSPFEVQFNNISTGLPDTYTWYFGDGTTATQQEPIEHTYFADTTIATYNITMVAINECGTDTAYYTISVLPNTVTSFFNTNITEGCEPLTVEFTDYSDGATQVSYNLGDGNFTGNDNPTHTYLVGDYTIYQYADNGCSYDTAQISIHVIDAPQIDFDTDVPNMCVNNAAQFIPSFDSATDFLWDFGDGSSSDLSSPTHFYTTGGNFVVTFTATNGAGCSSTIAHPFTVYQGPQASFSAPDQLGCSPFTLCVSNTTSNGLYYTWDFGDGNTASSTNACNTYTNVGNIGQQYTVTLIVEDIQLCADTFLMDITVAPQPISAFTLSSFESCYAPQSIDATNFSQYANGFEWRLDCDSISDIFQPTFQFADVGDYFIELVASNQYGCSSV